ncbi:unnamed protein product [Effrenium voratum]|nr:unnamed protein product [Effrenium voratum]
MRVLMIVIFLGSMAFFTVWSFRPPGAGLDPSMLSVAALLLWCCSCAGLGGMRAAFPETQPAGDPKDDEAWRAVTFLGCGCCTVFLGLCFLVAMTVAHATSGFTAAAVILWPAAAVLLCVFGCWLCRDCFGKNESADMACEGLACFFFWPLKILKILQKCFGVRGSSLKAVPTTQRRILFEDQVLPGRPPSPPGPGGTSLPGIRSSGPGLCKAPGTTGVTTGSRRMPQICGAAAGASYLEPKAWGCRWFTRWIENVEAVQQRCTLEVYYFNGRLGRGKVRFAAPEPSTCAEKGSWAKGPSLRHRRVARKPCATAWGDSPSE